VLEWNVRGRVSDSVRTKKPCSRICKRRSSEGLSFLSKGLGCSSEGKRHGSEERRSAEDEMIVWNQVKKS